MKHFSWKAVLSLMLILAMLCTVVPAADAHSIADVQKDFVAEKISHPEKPVMTADGIGDYVGNGLVVGHDAGQGARGQSYAWAAASYGDDLYVSTCFNAMGNTLQLMDSALGNNFDAESMEALLNVLFNGTFFTGEEDNVNTGGTLMKVNSKTGEVKVLMCRALDGRGPLFRNACNFKDKIYFCGAVNGLPVIYQVDPKTDKCAMVYQGMDQEDLGSSFNAGICVGIRGLTVFQDQLVVSCVTPEGPQILSSKEPWKGQEAFRQIASQKDLYDYPAYHYEDSIYGGSIFEMAVFHDSLYVSLCTGTPENQTDAYTMQSFAVVRGDMDIDGNWTWTPVIGDMADGAKYPFGIDPERTRAGAGVLMPYGDYLYIGEYNDEEIALENVLFGLDCEFLNRNLEQSVNLYRMDENEQIEMVVGDPTAMFPEGGLSGFGSGFGRCENQYIWRMNVYDGRLYVGTFDTSSLLEPLGQFVNGDLSDMTPEEWESLIEFIRIFLELQEKQPEDPKMNGVQEIFAQYSNAEIAAVMAQPDCSVMAEEQDPQNPSFQELQKIADGLLETAHRIRNATRGFDLYVTEDGIHFDTITVNGFGDPYNHGLRSYANTADGMYLGTANPFYGCQLWSLADAPAITFQSNLDIDFAENRHHYILKAPANTFEFSFTLTPLSTDDTILLNGEALESTSGVAQLHAGVNPVVLSILDHTGHQTDYEFNIFVAYCKGGHSCPSSHFTDIKVKIWYHEGVDYCILNGLMNGMSDTEFAPTMPITRGQFVTILWRQAGSPAAEKTAPFKDLTKDYYVDAIHWAWENNVVKGMTETTFGPEEHLRREDLAVLLYRYTKDTLHLDVSKMADLSEFPDANQVSDYAQDAMAWAVEAGIIRGSASGESVLLLPSGKASRAQVATIFMRYCQNVLG